MENLYLAHHGIKGMRWGVRRTPEQLADVGGGGGGGVGIDPDDVTDEMLEQLNDLTEETDGRENFTKEEAARLINGESVTKQVTWKDPKTGKVYWNASTYTRNGNSMKATTSGGEVVVKDGKRTLVRNKNFGGTADLGNKFSGMPVRRTSKQEAARNARLKSMEAESRRRIESHQRDVDRRVGEGRKKRVANEALSAAKRATGSGVKESAKRNRASSKAQEVLKINQHKRDVDAKINANKVERKRKVEEHQREVDAKINANKVERKRKVEEHQREVDARIAGAQEERRRKRAEMKRREKQRFA